MFAFPKPTKLAKQQKANSVVAPSVTRVRSLEEVVRSLPLNELCYSNLYSSLDAVDIRLLLHACGEKVAVSTSKARNCNLLLKFALDGSLRALSCLGQKAGSPCTTGEQQTSTIKTTMVHPSPNTGTKAYISPKIDGLEWKNFDTGHLLLFCSFLLYKNTLIVSCFQSRVSSRSVL
jgi:hypothetical protein